MSYQSTATVTIILSWGLSRFGHQCSLYAKYLHNGVSVVVDTGAVFVDLDVELCVYAVVIVGVVVDWVVLVSSDPVSI